MACEYPGFSEVDMVVRISSELLAVDRYIHTHPY
jgi:hypothetical protein